MKIAIIRRCIRLSVIVAMLVCSFNLVCAESELKADTKYTVSPEMLIKLMPPESDKDVRYAYKKQLIVEALEITRDTYGPYSLELRKVYARDVRAFRELELGGSINTLFALATPDREASAIPIHIPIRKGLLNYRLLLTKKQMLADFEGIKTVAQLKRKIVGMPVNWKTAELFKELGFNVANAHNRAGLYSMLERERFDYTILGVNEVYKEIEVNQLERLGFTIVPDLAIYINIPLYVFVSKDEPAIANRLKLGFERLIASGKFETLFNAEYLDTIRRANLRSRHIIEIDNIRLPASSKAIDAALWLDLTNPIYQAK